ncbi:MAG: hypothetical protein MZV63_68945 [Marinilabiliales bacterium]|nr:hypothetical protein [Marinilabiliales bacterium]
MPILSRRIICGVTAEVVKWISLDGREIEGLLYKPEGFDPAKQISDDRQLLREKFNGAVQAQDPRAGQVNH